MSRTDKTRPWRVKLLDAPANYREVHNHGKRAKRDENGEIVRVPLEGEFYPNGGQKYEVVYVNHPDCDLPADPRRDLGKYDGCRYDYTLEWAHSGEAQCSCRMCHGCDWLKIENRQRRYAAKKEIRDQLDEAGY